MNLTPEQEQELLEHVAGIVRECVTAGRELGQHDSDERITSLEADNKRLKEALAEIGAHDDQFSSAGQARAMRDRAREALHHQEQKEDWR